MIIFCVEKYNLRTQVKTEKKFLDEIKNSSENLDNSTSEESFSNVIFKPDLFESNNLKSSKLQS